MDSQTQELVETIERDGLVMLRSALDPTLVRQANEEVEAWLKIDLAERKEAGVAAGNFHGSAGRSSVDEAKHLLIDFFGKSPVLDRLAEQLLTEPRIAATVERAVGKHHKLRGYNIRHLTGGAEYSAMEWHRDNRGEFNFAILLNQTEPEGDGATCYIPGSHLFPYCPFQALYVRTPFVRYHPRMGYFTERLMTRVSRTARSAHGSPGDAYLFFGDIWHGRQPNLHGKTGTVLFFAVFPGEIPFPGHSKVEIPPPEILDRLPPGLRGIVQHDRVPVNSARSAFMYVMESNRRGLGGLSLWRLALWERKYRPNQWLASLTALIYKALRPLVWVKRRFKGLRTG
jgi:putative 2OG-Fe(II) oxygenase